MRTPMSLNRGKSDPAASTWESFEAAGNDMDGLPEGVRAIVEECRRTLRGEVENGEQKCASSKEGISSIAEDGMLAPPWSCKFYQPGPSPFHMLQLQWMSLDPADVDEDSHDDKEAEASLVPDMFRLAVADVVPLEFIEPVAERSAALPPPPQPRSQLGSEMLSGHKRRRGELVSALAAALNQAATATDPDEGFPLSPELLSFASVMGPDEWRECFCSDVSRRRSWDGSGGGGGSHGSDGCVALERCEPRQLARLLRACPTAALADTLLERALPAVSHRLSATGWSAGTGSSCSGGGSSSGGNEAAMRELCAGLVDAGSLRRAAPAMVRRRIAGLRLRECGEAGVEAEVALAEAALARGAPPC
ncbi:unnamed protein product [Phaeothamnion confervicola]